MRISRPFAYATILMIAAASAAAGEPAAPESSGPVETQSTPIQQEARLAPGDPAPSLDRATWLSGSPIEKFQPGQVYVLDFWATWCGPCIQSIPEMTELHNRMKDRGVHVIGVAVWPQRGGNDVSTRDFIAEQGDKMPYPVCEDEEAGTIARSYLTASGQEGIPSVIIVDQRGRIAWIGHPKSRMNEAVDATVAGTFDVEAFRKEYVSARERKEKLVALEATMRPAAREGRWEDYLAICDEMARVDPKMEGWAQREKYSILITQIKDRKRADALAATFVNETYRDDARELGEFARGVVYPATPFTPDASDLEFALIAARRAVQLTSSTNLQMLGTLARVHFARGEFIQAVEVQTKAVELAPDERAKAYLQQMLDEYREAASPQ